MCFHPARVLLDREGRLCRPRLRYAFGRWVLQGEIPVSPGVPRLSQDLTCTQPLSPPAAELQVFRVHSYAGHCCLVRQHDDLRRIGTARGQSPLKPVPRHLRQGLALQLHQAELDTI